jgi:hypothetical protein
MPATYALFRDNLLVALARKTNQHGREFYDYGEVADEAGLSRNPAWIEMAAFEFRDSGYTNDASSFDGFAGALTGLGMLEAERLTGAAERTVALDHDAPEYRRASSALDAVTEAVLQNNEYASSDPEEREQLLAELQAAKELLKPKRTRVHVFLTVAMSVLIWLADHFAGGVIGELASEAIAAVKALIDTLSLF